MKLNFFDNDKAFVYLHRLNELECFDKLMDTVTHPDEIEGIAEYLLAKEAKAFVENTSHGELGPDHAGRIEVDYAYQAEMHVQEAHRDPNLVRWELWARWEGSEDDVLCARWERKDGQICMTLRAEWYEGEWQLGVKFP